MNYRFLYLSFFCFFAMTIYPAYSKPDYACPKRIASIPQDALNQQVSVILQTIYKKLDCETTFIPLPGKRGILEFNMGQVDGEVFRLKVVEKLYTKPFAKSASPLYHLNSSYWINPNSKNSAIGYSLGIVWQENYMKNQRGISFRDNLVMFHAYNNGRIKGFLASDKTVRTFIKKGVFKIPPVQKENLLSAPIHHYLKAEFNDFMAVFSAYVEEHKPFKALNLSSN